MTLSAVDTQRVVRFAASALKERSGQNIQRLTGAIQAELGIKDAAGVREVVVGNWAAINEQAGLGALKRIDAGTRAGGFQQVDVDTTALGSRLPGKVRPEAALSTAQRGAAGTLAAREHERGKDVFSVHGPEYWDLPPDAHLRDAGLFRRLTEPLVRWTWVRDDGSKKGRGISGAEIEALTKPGPNGEAAALRPGDCLLNGGLGDPSHAALYVGKDALGRPMIIHSMATNNENRTALERLKDAAALPLTASKTGVLYEPLGEFFDRYHRDTVVVTRFPKLSPEQVERGLKRAHELIGDPYDYKLAPGTDAIYCTEVYLEFLKSAVDGDTKKLPYMGTTFHQGGGLLKVIGVKAFVCEPAHVAASPHMEIGALLGNGAAALEDLRRTHVLGPGAQRAV